MKQGGVVLKGLVGMQTFLEWAEMHKDRHVSIQESDRTGEDFSGTNTV